MTLKWFGAVSTRITLCRSDFSVSILWALAASTKTMVKTMVFCMPKFPAIPALLQKVGQRHGFRALIKKREPNPRDRNPGTPSGEAKIKSEYRCPAGACGPPPATSNTPASGGIVSLQYMGTPKSHDREVMHLRQPDGPSMIVLLPKPMARPFYFD